MLVCVLAIGAIFAVSQVQAETIINWGTPTNISGDSDVVTANSSFERAYNFVDTPHSTSTTVNGVLFSAFNVAVRPSGSYSPDYDITWGNTNLKVVTADNTARFEGTTNLNAYAVSTPFGGLSSEYQTLLKSNVAMYPGGASPVLTLGGLTDGQQYLFQVWVNDSRHYANATKLVTGASTVTLDTNTTDATGGVGQYVTGTFTASGNSQSITLDKNVAIYLCGFQLRTITIPEPSTVMLLATGLVGLLAYGWRKRK